MAVQRKSTEYKKTWTIKKSVKPERTSLSFDAFDLFFVFLMPVSQIF
jgi:hypothetical protein